MDHVIDYLEAVMARADAQVNYAEYNVSRAKLNAIVELAEKRRFNYASIGDWEPDLDAAKQSIDCIETWARENFAVIAMSLSEKIT